MAKRISIISVAIIILGAMFSLSHNDSAASVGNREIARTDLNGAMQSTVMINMYGFEPAEIDANGMVTKMAEPSRTEGLGTAVVQNGQTYIVTHDHWSLLNDELELVQIRDASGTLVAQMDGEEFGQRIQYRDGGTIVLSAPQALGQRIQTTSLDGAQSIEKGAVVQVVHRRRDGQGGVATVEATVQGIEFIDGVPTLKLRSANGHVIVPGDSGGGIWYEGELVGNMWMTVTMDVAGQVSSANGEGESKIEKNWSRAAVMTRNIQEQLQDVASQPATTEAAPGANVTEVPQQPALAPEVQEGGIG